MPTLFDFNELCPFVLKAEKKSLQQKNSVTENKKKSITLNENRSYIYEVIFCCFKKKKYLDYNQTTKISENQINVKVNNKNEDEENKDSDKENFSENESNKKKESNKTTNKFTNKSQRYTDLNNFQPV